tara:strand:+ start:512 stop:832 length:321 start_codon:yes stop_codon:yes gene_type:complete
MLGATNFLSDFVKDEVKCRGLSIEDFGAQIDNEKNDIPLYDMYNRGLAACEQGMERKNLGMEGQRPGLTGYIPSMEEAMKNYPGVSVRPKTLLLALDSPNSKMKGM